MALADNLVSYWNFNESSGNLIDQVASNDGTISGATQGSTGIIGTGYDFDGTDDYVYVADDASLDITGNMSVSIWVYADAIGLQGIAGKWSVNNASRTWLFTCGALSSNKVSFMVSDGSDGGVGSTDSANLSTIAWTHFVGVYDGTNVTLYRNGSAMTPTSYLNKTLASTAKNVNFGLLRDDHADKYFFNGRIDECGLWNKALSSAEVTELYNSGAGKAYPFSTIETHGTAYTDGSNQTGKAGMKITIGGTSQQLISVTEWNGAGVTATTAYLCDSSLNVIASASYSSHVATFGSPPVMSASGTYYVLSDAGGSSYHYHFGTASYPIAGTKLNWTGGYSVEGGGDRNDLAVAVSSITVQDYTATGTNMKINIGDIFKDISEIKINIGDAFKAVVKAQVNIGDAWKTIFG